MQAKNTSMQEKNTPFKPFSSLLLLYIRMDFMLLWIEFYIIAFSNCLSAESKLFLGKKFHFRSASDDNTLLENQQVSMEDYFSLPEN